MCYGGDLEDGGDKKTSICGGLEKMYCAKRGDGDGGDAKNGD